MNGPAQKEKPLTKRQIAEAAKAEAEAKENPPDQGPEGPAADQQPATVEDLLSELPMSDQNKKMLVALVGGLSNNLTQINSRLAAIENGGNQDGGAELFDGLTADQKYDILMTRAAAPAKAGQSDFLQSLLQGLTGGGGGNKTSEIDQLLASGERIKALRDAFTPEATPMQVAMEQANIASVLAQTRLMNRVTGKATSELLDKIEKDLMTGGKSE